MQVDATDTMRPEESSYRIAISLAETKVRPAGSHEDVSTITPVNRP